MSLTDKVWFKDGKRWRDGVVWNWEQQGKGKGEGEMRKGRKSHISGLDPLPG